MVRGLECEGLGFFVERGLDHRDALESLGLRVGV